MPIVAASKYRVYSPRTYVFFLGLLTFSIISCLTALSLGSLDISLQEIIAAVFDSQDTLHRKVIFDIRFPRVASGFIIGGMLSLAGCLMQVLLRNPLAEPYVLGVSGGASVFALLAMAAGLSGLIINLSAFAGSILTIFLVFSLSHIGGNWNALRMLLTGVVIAAGWGALISFILAISPGTQVQGMLFWLMGDLSYARYSHFSLLVLITSFVISMGISRHLNVLGFGDQQALSLGVPVVKIRYVIYFMASLLTASSVMLAGSIGFIGLVVPHITRLVCGTDHRIVLPASVFLGGSLLVFADALARTVIAPQQLPVGVLTALLGVPIFLVLLQSHSMKQKP
jgi:iron complex transport system permease protein